MNTIGARPQLDTAAILVHVIIDNFEIKGVSGHALKQGKPGGLSKLPKLEDRFAVLLNPLDFPIEVCGHWYSLSAKIVDHCQRPHDEDDHKEGIRLDEVDPPLGAVELPHDGDRRC